MSRSRPDWSLGETQALAAKAARGAGYPWGLAEEAGQAVRWLQAQGLPGAAALAGFLAGRDEAGEAGGALCPLGAGAALCDRASALKGELPLELPGLSFPLLLLPFAAAAAGMAGLALTLSWGSAVFRVEAGEVSGRYQDDGVLVPRADAALRLEAAADLARCARATRVPESAGPAMAALEGFAARTYAPASERSRLTGAGAGTEDQD